MPRTKPPYPPEFRREAVELVRAGACLAFPDQVALRANRFSPHGDDRNCLRYTERWTPSCVAPIRCAPMAGQADPFKPPAGVVFSKGEVNRAGELLRSFYLRPLPKEGEDDYTGFDVDELVDAMIAVTWWRGLHARPLSKVAANLRYHVGAEDAEVGGRVDVTQRLKRRPTIFDELDPPGDGAGKAGAGANAADVPHLGQLHRRLSGQPAAQEELDDRADQGLHRDAAFVGLPRCAPHRQTGRAADRGPATHRSARCLGESGRGRQQAPLGWLQVWPWRGGCAWLLPRRVGCLLGTRLRRGIERGADRCYQ